MPPVILFEDEGWVDLLPMLYWRSGLELRLGRKIAMDRAAQRMGRPIAGAWTRPWIAQAAQHRCGTPVNRPAAPGTLLLNCRWLFDERPVIPTAESVGMVNGEVAWLVVDDALAKRLRPDDMLDGSRREGLLGGLATTEAGGRMIRYPWELIAGLADRLHEDWRDADAAIESEVDGRVLCGPTSHIHIGEGCRIHPTAVIDADGGPVYVSQSVQIGPHAVVEGPCYIAAGTHVNPHAWLHGANAIGAICKIGGEVDGCIIDGCTNKQHSGFLGHSYVGSWVNIGAGANNSDLKNTYGEIRVPVRGDPVETGLKFFGAVIGDHAKIGIGANIPTGAWIGFAAMAAADGAFPKYIPSFGWVTDGSDQRGDPARLLDTACTVMARRSVDMTDAEVELFLSLDEISRQHERPARADPGS